MTISEVANLLEIDISTVRFYERKGLINPARRQDSKYRDYSNEDVMKLKSIMLYRKLDFSIDDIQALLSGESDVMQMLTERKQKLESEKEKLMASLTLCEKMIEDNVGADMEVDHYLSYVHEEEAKGQNFPDIIPALDTIADNMYMERYLDMPFMRTILQNDILRRLAALIVFGLLVVFPVIEIVTSVIAVVSGTGSLTALIVWCLIGVALISEFVVLIRKK